MHFLFALFSVVSFRQGEAGEIGKKTIQGSFFLNYSQKTNMSMENHRIHLQIAVFFHCHVNFRGSTHFGGIKFDASVAGNFEGFTYNWYSYIVGVGCIQGPWNGKFLLQCGSGPLMVIVIFRVFPYITYIVLDVWVSNKIIP